MRKKLSEMSLEELWELFPIFLTGHQECWDEWYREEKRALGKALEDVGPVRISHIGSTAVETIWAKPIIDILVEVTEKEGLAEPEKRLLGCGYRCMSRGERKLSFNKGYTYLANQAKQTKKGCCSSNLPNCRDGILFSDIVPFLPVFFICFYLFVFPVC